MGDNSSEFEVRIQGSGGAQTAADIAQVAPAINTVTAAQRGMNAATAGTVATSAQRIEALKAEEVALRTRLAVLKETETLQRQQAAQQAAGGGEGAGVGEIAGLEEGLTKPFVALGALVGKVAVTLSNVGEEMRKLARDDAADIEKLGDAIEAGPVAAFERARNKARDLKRELDDLGDKGWASKMKDLFTEAFGGMTNDEKAARALHLLHEFIDLQKQAATESHAQALGQQDVSKLRLDGLDAAAKAKQQELDKEKELHAAETRFKPIRPDDPFEVADKQKGLAQAKADIEEKYRLTAQETEKHRAEAAAKELAHMRAMADAEEEKADGEKPEAAKMRVKIALAEKLAQLEKDRKAGKLTLGEQRDIEDEETRKAKAAEGVIDRKQAEKEQREAIAADEKAKREQERADREAEREAAKAEREAERVAKADAEFDKRKTDAGFEIQIAEARAKGEADVVAWLTIEKALADQIAGIMKTDMTGAQKARLAGLAEEEAALKRVAAARGKFNDEFDKAIAEKNKTPEQKRREREGRKIGRRQEREEISKQVESEDLARRNNRERGMTPEEKVARKKELAAARGREKDHKKPDVADAARKLREAEKPQKEADPNEIDVGKGHMKEVEDRMRKERREAIEKARRQNRELPDLRSRVNQGFDSKEDGAFRDDAGADEFNEEMSKQPGAQHGGGPADAGAPLQAAGDTMQASLKAAATSLQNKADASAAAIAAIDLSGITRAIEGLTGKINQALATS